MWLSDIKDSCETSDWNFMKRHSLSSLTSLVLGSDVHQLSWSIRQSNQSSTMSTAQPGSIWVGSLTVWLCVHVWPIPEHYYEEFNQPINRQYRHCAKAGGISLHQTFRKFNTLRSLRRGANWTIDQSIVKAANWNYQSIIARDEQKGKQVDKWASKRKKWGKCEKIKKD